MRKGPILAVFITGAAGIIAQVILLRELLVGFYGNELTLGIILANWVLAEAIGAAIGGWLAAKTKNTANVFGIFTLVFSVILPVAVYFSRTFKPLLGIPFGEGIGLSAVFTVSFLILLPAAFCHGALFSVGAKILSSLGKMYAWETLGTVAGGLLITYLFLPYTNSFFTVFVVAGISVLSVLLLWRSLSKILKSALFVFCCITGLLLCGKTINAINKNSIARQWQNEKVISYRNSLYGNIAVTSQPGQLTFFYNGAPIIVSPQPDVNFTEDFGDLPLLFHSQPKRILVLSGGAGGLITEILKSPGVTLNYTELDPAIIKEVREHSDELTSKELNDPRVRVILQDGSFFLRSDRQRYDVILIGVSRVSDLTENRYFTSEFFALAKERLNPGGILSLWMPGSLAHLSQDLKDINASIYNSLLLNYPYVRIIPGDFNIYLASADKEILQITPAAIAKRLAERNITTNFLVLSYLQYRLDPNKVVWFHNSLAGATTRLNQDLKPYAVFKALVLWSKQFSPRLAGVLDRLEKITLQQVALTILLLSFILFFVFRRFKRPIKPALTFSIFTTGFFGMLISLMLVFSFQVFTGYLYHKIGLLVSIFMTGSALGSLAMTKWRLVNKYSEVSFVWLELLIVNFTLGCAAILTVLAKFSAGLPLFIGLFFISGALLGMEFPLAGKIYQREKNNPGQACAVLYGADLMGGWLAGITAGIFFLPLLGIFASCLVIALLKLSSLLLLVFSLQGPKGPETKNL